MERETTCDWICTLNALSGMYDIKLNDTVCHRKPHAAQHHPDLKLYRYTSVFSPLCFSLSLCLNFFFPSSFNSVYSIYIQICYRLIMQMEFKWYHRRARIDCDVSIMDQAVSLFNFSLSLGRTHARKLISSCAVRHCWSVKPSSSHF